MTTPPFALTLCKLADGAQAGVPTPPFTLSLSKGEGRAWFDRLTTNGEGAVHPEPVEGPRPPFTLTLRKLADGAQAGVPSPPFTLTPSKGAPPVHPDPVQACGRDTAGVPSPRSP